MSNSIHVGDVAHITAAFRVDDVLTNPTTVRLEVLRPSDDDPDVYIYGTDSEVTRPSTGLYEADIPIIESGLHTYRWESTGTAEGAEEGTFNVPHSPF